MPWRAWRSSSSCSLWAHAARAHGDSALRLSPLSLIVIIISLFGAASDFRVPDDASNGRGKTRAAHSFVPFVRAMDVAQSIVCNPIYHCTCAQTFDAASSLFQFQFICEPNAMSDMPQLHLAPFGYGSPDVRTIAYSEILSINGALAPGTTRSKTILLKQGSPTTLWSLSVVNGVTYDVSGHYCCNAYASGDAGQYFELSAASFLGGGQYVTQLSRVEWTVRYTCKVGSGGPECAACPALCTSCNAVQGCTSCSAGYVAPNCYDCAAGYARPLYSWSSPCTYCAGNCTGGYKDSVTGLCACPTTTTTQTTTTTVAPSPSLCYRIERLPWTSHVIGTPSSVPLDVAFGDIQFISALSPFLQNLGVALGVQVVVTSAYRSTAKQSDMIARGLPHPAGGSRHLLFGAIDFNLQLAAHPAVYCNSKCLIANFFATSTAPTQTGGVHESFFLFVKALKEHSGAPFFRYAPPWDGIAGGRDVIHIDFGLPTPAGALSVQEAASLVSHLCSGKCKNFNRGTPPKSMCQYVPTVAAIVSTTSSPSAHRRTLSTQGGAHDMQLRALAIGDDDDDGAPPANVMAVVNTVQTAFAGDAADVPDVDAVEVAADGGYVRVWLSGGTALGDSAAATVEAVASSLQARYRSLSAAGVSVVEWRGLQDVVSTPADASSVATSALFQPRTLTSTFETVLPAAVPWLAELNFSNVDVVRRTRTRSPTVLVAAPRGPPLASAATTPADPNAGAHAGADVLSTASATDGGSTSTSSVSTTATPASSAPPPSSPATTPSGGTGILGALNQRGTSHAASIPSPLGFALVMMVLAVRCFC